MTLRTFQGSVAIVTGAGSGIGRALATQLAKAGSDVILADRQEDQVMRAAAEIAGGGHAAMAVTLDVRSSDAVQEVVARCVRDKGRLDFMFNNAGVGVGGNIEQHNLADWEQIIDVNIKGVVYGVHAALGPMEAQGFGHIVNTASISGLIPVPGLVAYCTTKHAIVGLSKSLRGEVARAGIRVTALCPGAVNTPLLSGGHYGRFHGVSPRVGKRILSPFRPLEPLQFAALALRAIKKNKPLVVVPWQYKLVWLMLRTMPTSWEIALTRSHMEHQRRAAEEDFGSQTADDPAERP